MTLTEQFNKAVSKAKLALMQKRDAAFFISLCFSLKHSMSESIPTAATNGAVVYYNPHWFISMSVEEQIFLMLHETMHCAYLHILRAKSLGLDKEKANVAADHVINLQLLERGFTMPKSIPGLADPKYKGMNMEQIYKLLPEMPKGSSMGDLQPDLGDGGEPGSGSTKSDHEIEQAMQNALVRASIQSQAAGDKKGTVPGDIEIFLNKLLNPKLPWPVILRRHVNSFTKNDFSWRKPNRRYFPDMYLPSLWSESLKDLTIAIDTSGSVSDEDFKQMITEVASIFRMMKPKKITLIQFDTDIKAVNQIRNISDLMHVKFSGRGGTYIQPVFDYLEKNPTQLFLAFTDGYFDFPHHNPKYPVIWLIHDNPNWTARFGKVIHYEKD